MVAFNSALSMLASSMLAGAASAAAVSSAASAAAATTAAVGSAASAVAVSSGASAAAVGSAAFFDPNTYTKKYVTCNAVQRNGTTTTPITLKLAYLDINPTAKKTLIMVHGWPSLWTTYRNQITGLGSQYRLILPENRGFGDSQHPADLYQSNTMPDVSIPHDAKPR
jgi:soluble epoxide hydrolase/lipid-phosphate phosphatase